MQREMMRAREGNSLHIDRLVKTYFQPIYRRVGDLLHKGIAEGEFRAIDPAHFVPSMVAMIVFYFSSAPVMQKIMRFNPLSPERIAERRAAVLDFISAVLFATRTGNDPAKYSPRAYVYNSERDKSPSRPPRAGPGVRK
jgi:hypothetical protein